MIGNRNVKNASSRLRQKRRCSTRSVHEEPHLAHLVVAGQREVDLLERGGAPRGLQLAPGGERLAGQLVQEARRLLRRDDDLLAVAAVADLGRGRRAGQLRGRAIATIRPSRRTATRSASCSASSR